jgi:hypothetical protein
MEMTMRKLTWLLLLPATVLVACGRGDSPKLDDALKNDLALASQAQGYNPQQFISPAEAGYGAQPGYAPQAIQTVARQPVSTARRTTPARRTSSASSGRSYPTQAPEQVIKHTQRDAIIGAAAGAIIGAATSRDKVKGGLIGAAAGGILGAVVGNNVDVERRRGW